MALLQETAQMTRQGKILTGTWILRIYAGYQTVGIDCANMTFAINSLLIESAPRKYATIAPISEIRGWFSNVTKHSLLVRVGVMAMIFSIGVKTIAVGRSMRRT
ncbi:hypothetical protein RJZ57_002215 [Blastomyces gilchristii]